MDTLTADCRALLAKGDVKGAIQKTQAAVQQNPDSALPHGVLSEVLLGSLPWTKPDMAAKFRQDVKAEAMKALAVDPAQPNALESLRYLEGRAHGVGALVSAPVMSQVDQAEAQLRSGHPEQAAQAFEEIEKAAPGVAGIACYAGDAWLAAGKTDPATSAYQRALKVKADCAPALVGLAVINARQGHLDEARDFAMRAIQSDPAERHSWDAYEAIEKQAGRTLTHLSLPLFAVAKFPGKNQVEWMVPLPEDLPDYKFWEEYCLSINAGMEWSRHMARDANGAAIARSPFGISLDAWSKTVRALPSKDDPSWDPIIPWMRKFERSNQLQPAVFTLFFDPRWEGEYRAWLKSNPDEIRKFLQSYSVRPDFP